MQRVVTMGEMMIRLMPKGNLRFEQAECFDAFYGGDESIVAASLSRLGLPTSYVTRLPDSVFGDIAVQKLMAQGVDVTHIVRGEGRMGLNFYENGASVRPSVVMYDRAHSAMALAEPKHFDFDAAFEGAQWFHVSGITPALSEGAHTVTEQALRKAKSLGLTTSMDLNYRRKLWSPQKARKVMTALMEYVDVCVGNEEEADICLGFTPGDTNVQGGALDLDGYRTIFTRMRERFGFKLIATTLRESRSASDNGWSVLLYDGNEFAQSPVYDIHLVDRGGGGAAFSAGLIYSQVNGMKLQQAANFSGAASALKQTILGDFNLARLDEVMTLADGNASGRVQR